MEVTIDWGVVSAIASIIGALAAGIAAYFAYQSRPRKVSNVIITAEYLSFEEPDIWTIEFCSENYEKEITLHGCFASIYTPNKWELKRVLFDKPAPGCLITAPNVIFDKQSINYNAESVKPKTKKCFSVIVKAIPNVYDIDWEIWGNNLKKQPIKGSLKLDLTKHL